MDTSFLVFFVSTILAAQACLDLDQYKTYCPQDTPLYHINNKASSDCYCVSKQQSNCFPINSASQYTIGNGYNNVGSCCYNAGNCNNVGSNCNNVGSICSNVGTSCNNVGSSCNNFGLGCNNVGSNSNNVGSNCNNVGLNCNNVGSNCNNNGPWFYNAGLGYSGLNGNNIGSSCNKVGSDYNIMYDVPLYSYPCDNGCGSNTESAILTFGLVKKSNRGCQCGCQSV